MNMYLYYICWPNKKSIHQWIFTNIIKPLCIPKYNLFIILYEFMIIPYSVIWTSHLQHDVTPSCTYVKLNVVLCILDLNINWIIMWCYTSFLLFTESWCPEMKGFICYLSLAAHWYGQFSIQITFFFNIVHFSFIFIKKRFLYRIIH